MRDGGADLWSSCSLFPGQLEPPPSVGGAAPPWQHVLHDIILPWRAKVTWNNYYDDLVRLLIWKRDGANVWRKRGNAALQRPMRILEIGTMFGGAADRIMRNISGAQLWVVDPFLAGFDPRDPLSAEFARHAREFSLTESGLSLAWAQGMAHDFRRRHGCDYHLLHAKSSEAVSRFADGFFDAAFIDGVHTYEGVMTDVRAWWPKLNASGGVAIFNDYGTSRHPSVRRAVDGFARQNGLRVVVGAKGRPPGHRNAFVIKA